MPLTLPLAHQIEKLQNCTSSAYQPPQYRKYADKQRLWHGRSCKPLLVQVDNLEGLGRELSTELGAAPETSAEQFEKPSKREFEEVSRSSIEKVFTGGYDWHNSTSWSYDKFWRELSWREPSIKKPGESGVSKLFWLIRGWKVL